MNFALYPQVTEGARLCCRIVDRSWHRRVHEIGNGSSSPLGARSWQDGAMSLRMAIPFVARAAALAAVVGLFTRNGRSQEDAHARTEGIGEGVEGG